MLRSLLDTTDQGVEVDGSVEGAAGTEEITFGVDDGTGTAYREVVRGVLFRVCAVVWEVVPVEEVLYAPL